MEYNQDQMNQKFKPEITTGGYGDRNFNDEWMWAATELFLTTKDKKYNEIVQKHLEDKVLLPTWNRVGMLAYYSFIRLKNHLPAFTNATIKIMEDKVIEIADQYIEKVAANAFGTVMGQTKFDFTWGGNSNAANQGILLVRAYLISGNKKYIDYALTNLDYLLGRNATGYCFITGIGSKSTMHPHHRESVADGVTDPVPGLMAGGPNAGMQDHCKYEFTETETAYADISCAYASNEIAINWNAPIVYLSNAIEALQQKVGYDLK
jgi:endoglucanase